MAQFNVNTDPQRFDPYKNFKFRIKWDGNYVAGVSKISALSRTTEVVEHREGGDPSTVRRSPGQTRYEAITLERGVTHDVEFERWANKVWNFGAGLGSEVSLQDFRKDEVTENQFLSAKQTLERGDVGALPSAKHRWNRSTLAIDGVSSSSRMRVSSSSSKR